MEINKVKKSNKFCHKWLFIGLMGFVLTSCVNNQIPFSQKAWNEWDGYYDYRKLVIDDLLKNHLHKGMLYQDVIDLLGKSYSTNSDTCAQDTTTSIEIEYEVEVKTKFSDIDPVGGSYLKIIFGKDSLITNYKVIEWKKGER